LSFNFLEFSKFSESLSHSLRQSVWTWTWLGRDSDQQFDCDAGHAAGHAMAPCLSRVPVRLRSGTEQPPL